MLATPVIKMRLPERKPIALILIVIAYFYFNNHNVNIVISK
ncbi:Hypothetical protein KpB31_3030 [Klebsiella pneumoniae]|uniref:Uncharacterized protein n=1 Tax=Klebsiella pneumoniae 30684/NJST258_2 TaxID=1420013 RepID=W8ULM8_KLEPN|nr:hypothetical protein KPNJ2_03205 [Klebsiella pneumoniae 30684/NJST258_2]AHM85620.1 hypothetical protein KPNJ1_03214 [Klebsiella pneumoniae 30660/NJST258_1]AIK79787.1 hypothetical protein VK055_1164 [Klebsiella pneumoniae subsp. pneumoniae]AJC05055.1 hypothetical protein P243_2994 [Klebsiella pneumoniae subsp. pneumoniae 1158]AVJ85804.1 hypothetical protein CSC00_0069 [Klebsiella pneumoniae]